MSFLKNIFGGSTSDNYPKKSPVKFGRYTAVNKNSRQLKGWDNSVKLFAEKKYTDAYVEFFSYLRDDNEDNVHCSTEGGKLNFSIAEGSKIVKGYADKDKVVAEVNIAGFDALNVAFMRKLMNMNFDLLYSRFALKDNRICLKFTSHILDASPYKMFYSLKELATRADKEDHILINEFKMLKPIDVEHLTGLTDQEKEVKYKYIQKWISDALNRISELEEVKFSGTISYLLLR